MKYEFTVMGEAKGQPRVKAFARKLKDGSTVARVYTPGTAEAWKSAIAMEAKDAGLAGLMSSGPVRIHIVCYFQRPVKHFGTGKNAQTIKQGAPDAHTQTPDFDNIAKAACDALTTIGVWKNDKQIFMGAVAKFWSVGESYTIFQIELS